MLSLLLAGVAGSLGLVFLDYWRRGMFGLGVVLLAGAVARLVLPERVVGLLAVRSRAFDVALLIGLGVAVIGLTLAVPYPRA